MSDEQLDLLSPIQDLEMIKHLLADLHDDLLGKVARFRHLMDLSSSLGAGGTMMPGGEVTFTAWTEIRTSYIHGNYIATVTLCQGLAEHILAAELALRNLDEELPKRITFEDTLRRCVSRDMIAQQDAEDLRRLMELRNPLSHYRGINDPNNLSRRVLNTRTPAEYHLFGDASFALSIAIRLLSLPAFRLDSGATLEPLSD